MASGERAADESSRRGKEGIAEVDDATRVGGRRQRQCTRGQRDERRWWVADDVTRVADDDGRRTMMSGDERS